MSKGKLMNLSAMVIFGTIGIFVRHIPLPSSLIALVRAAVGLAFLSCALVIQRKKPDFSAIRRNGLLLIVGGVFLGGNWIALFESYRHTSVSVATMCYYMAPVIVMLVSGESRTMRHWGALLGALTGMVLVTAPAGASGSWVGPGLGLLAAMLYAGVILSNRRLNGLTAFDTTLVQLGVAAAVLAPYVLVTVDVAALSPAPVQLFLLAVVGVIHTGLAYTLYFGSIPMLPARTVAMYGYLDPIVAVVLSALVLGEPLTIPGLIGIILVLGSTAFSEKDA